MKKIVSLILIGFVATSMIFAQNNPKSEVNTENEAKADDVVKLSIDEAVEYALKHSRTLKSNDIDLELKERASKNSWNVFLPNVSVSGTFSRSNKSNYGTVVSTAGQMAAWNSGNMAAYKNGEAIAKSMGYEDDEVAHWTTLGTVSVGWNFTPAYIAKIKTAKAQYEAGQITWEQTQRETVTNIKKAYYGLLLQQENLKIQKTTLENKRQRMIQSQTNFKNGSIPEIQYLRTQVDYENAKPEVDTAEQGLRQQVDMLAFMIGMPVGTKIELTSSIEPTYVDVEADDLLAKYSDCDLQIQTLEKNKLAAKLGITALDLSTWLPTLALNYSYQPVYTGVNAFKFAGDIGDGDKWTDKGSLSLTLAWNITNMLPWSSNRQQVKDYKQQLAQLELKIATHKENKKVQVRKAVDTLHQAREQIDAMGRNVTLAQRAYDMTARQYRNGTTELLDLRDAETSLNQAKLGQINQKFQYISALMDLENTLNVSLTK